MPIAHLSTIRVEVRIELTYLPALNLAGNILSDTNISAKLLKILQSISAEVYEPFSQGKITILRRDFEIPQIPFEKLMIPNLLPEGKRAAV